MGFYLSAERLHLSLVLKSGPGELLILKEDSFPLPSSSESSSFFIQASTLVLDFLKDHCSTEESLALLNFCLNIDQCTTRSACFPFTKKFKIKNSLPFHLEDEIPLPPEKVLYEASLYHTQPKEAELLAIATQKDHVIPWVEFFHSESTPLNMVTFEAAALGNFLLKSQPKSTSESLSGLFFTEKYVIFIYLKQGKLAEVYYLDDPTLPFLKSLQIQTGALPEMVSKMNFSPHSPQAPYIKKHFVPLVQSLSLHFKSLESQHEDFQKCPLFVWGKVTGAKDFDSTLEADLNKKVFILDGHPLFAEKSYPEIISIGTAMEGLKNYQEAPINFIPKSFSTDQVSLVSAFKQIKKILPLTLAGIFILGSYATVKKSLIQNNSEKLQLTLSRGTENTPHIQGNFNLRSYKKFEEFQKRKDKTIAFLEGLEKQKNVSLEFFEKFQRSILNHFKESQLKIEKINVGSKSMSISGAIESSSYKLFQKHLSSLGKIEKDVTQAVKDKESYVSFSVTITKSKTPKKKGGS